MSHRETRFRKARDWKADDYVRWFSKSDGSLDTAADYLKAMSTQEKKMLSLMVSDIAHDIARDKKRSLAEEQLFDGEELTSW
jgi:hypothetical protein